VPPIGAVSFCDFANTRQRADPITLRIAASRYIIDADDNDMLTPTGYPPLQHSSRHGPQRTQHTASTAATPRYPQGRRQYPCRRAGPTQTPCQYSCLRVSFFVSPFREVSFCEFDTESGHDNSSYRCKSLYNRRRAIVYVCLFACPPSGKFPFASLTQRADTVTLVSLQAVI